MHSLRPNLPNLRHCDQGVVDRMPDSPHALSELRVEHITALRDRVADCLGGFVAQLDTLSDLFRRHLSGIDSNVDGLFADLDGRLCGLREHSSSDLCSRPEALR